MTCGLSLLNHALASHSIMLFKLNTCLQMLRSTVYTHQSHFSSSLLLPAIAVPADACSSNPCGKYGTCQVLPGGGYDCTCDIARDYFGRCELIKGHPFCACCCARLCGCSGDTLNDCESGKLNCDVHTASFAAAAAQAQASYGAE